MSDYGVLAFASPAIVGLVALAYGNYRLHQFRAARKAELSADLEAMRESNPEVAKFLAEIDEHAENEAEAFDKEVQEALAKMRGYWPKGYRYSKKPIVRFSSGSITISPAKKESVDDNVKPALPKTG